jgi:hypothetical protein
MTKQSHSDSTLLQMEQARQLLDLGHVGEAMQLVLEVLNQELQHLRVSLEALKTQALGEAPASLGESPWAGPGGEPEARFRARH